MISELKLRQMYLPRQLWKSQCTPLDPLLPEKVITPQRMLGNPLTTNVERNLLPRASTLKDCVVKASTCSTYRRFRS